MNHLTKSKFKLATECPTKLFYTGKKDEYANTSSAGSIIAFHKHNQSLKKVRKL